MGTDRLRNKSSISLALSAFWWAGVCIALPASAHSAEVELELVLAIDTSASVDDREYLLQIDGIANAFRTPLVIDTIRATGDNGIAVTLVMWSSSFQQVQAVGWTHIDSAENAYAFATLVAAIRKREFSGNTAIGNALRFASRLFEANGFEGRRRAIDISGDGRNNSAMSTSRARDRYVGDGITINGLAIRAEDPGLLDYYQDEVIGGTGAFAIAANDFNDFSHAIIRKLLRELASPLSQLRKERPHSTMHTAGTRLRHAPHAAYSRAD